MALSPGRREGPPTAPHIAWAVAATTIVYAVVAVVSLSFGSSEVGGATFVWEALTGRLGEAERTILWRARFPRVAMAGIVGAALATSGAVFQAVLRNPLADPYILGISGGAALGGTAVLAAGAAVGAGWMGAAGLAGIAGALTPAVAAFVGALGSVAVIFGVGRLAPGGRGGTYVLLLTGVVVNAFASAVILFFKSVVSARKAQEILFYLMGTLAVGGTDGSVVATIGGLVALCLAGLLWFARDLNVLSLGEREAASLGVDARFVRRATVGIASLAVAASVAFTGLIGFVGLVVPHGIRLLTGPDHRLLLPCCAVGGAAFLTASDLAARASFDVFSTALPVGVVTAFVGAPLFMVFLWRNLSRATAEGGG
ncbi:MAG: FecCD family ABC transporter permease [Bradymonadaceae bacterium]